MIGKIRLARVKADSSAISIKIKALRLDEKFPNKARKIAARLDALSGHLKQLADEVD